VTFAERAYEHRDELLGYLCRRGMARNRHDAEDLVHEIISKAIAEEQKGKYEERGTLRAWLFEMLRHEAYRYRLKLKRISRTTIDDLDSGRISHTARVWGVARAEPERARPDDGDELSETVLAAMQQLSDEQYEVVYRRFSGQTYEQIAKACSISIGTVGSRLDRAARKLRPMLGDYALARYGIGAEQ
jgi:RNA polymerase sigma-70 factor, ECF subfamily